jgi:ABC-type uncharacterized transport system substrate-binding protein
MAAVGEALGTIESLAHPGGNVTGMSAFTTGLAAKRVELLKKFLPTVAHVAYVHNMNNPVAPPPGLSALILQDCCRIATSLI